MARKQFTIQEVAELDDGRIALMINKNLRIATEDCSNRPGVKKARKVAVVFEITPVIDESGMCTEVDIEFVSASSLPKSRSKTVNMAVQPKGELLFNPASEDDVHQHTLDEA